MGVELPQFQAHALDFLSRARRCLRTPERDREKPFQFGVDLGTATIMLCAVDATGDPVYWDYVARGVVRDGVVVDFEGAARAVSELKRRAEAELNVLVDSAATAHPPGVPTSDCRACRYVLEQAGVKCRLLTDEVSAAQRLLQVRDGVVVDVGGGSTGVGMFRNGKLVALSDRPGGGHYLDLILAGALGISISDAEARKRADGAAVMNLIRPGIERIADSIRRQCNAEKPIAVYLAGGALLIPGAERVVQSYLNWPVVAYPHADLITPFGIALS